MKILTIGNFTTGWDGSICDEEHIAGALESLGHEVIRYQREVANETIDWMDGYDFTLIAQWDGYQVGMVADLPKPLVYWAFDYQENGQEWHERLIAHADLYLSKPFKDSKYPNWQWLSQDFAPSFLDKWQEPISVEMYEQAPLQKDIDVLFTGSWVPWESGQERVAYLKAIDEKFNLQINSFTPDQWKAEGFKNVQGPVMDYDLPALIARAKINFSMDHVISPGYWSDRTAQIMCCGGLVLMKYVPFAEATFRDHIVYCYDIEDCISRIEQLLERPDEDLLNTADEGYYYAKNYLKVTDRIRDLITIVQGIL